MTVSSSGDATGRASGWKRRVKKSFQDVKPQCGSPGLCWYCSMPIAFCASGEVHPAGESFRT
jgi:hypothetical protein